MSCQKVFEDPYLCSLIYTFINVINIKNGNNDQVFFFGKKMYVQGIMAREVKDFFCLDSFKYLCEYLPLTFVEKHENSMRQFLCGLRLYPTGLVGA